MWSYSEKMRERKERREREREKTTREVSNLVRRYKRGETRLYRNPVLKKKIQRKSTIVDLRLSKKRRGHGRAP
jgi:hypothetical protein